MSSTNPDRVEGRGLGWKFWLALLAIAIAIGIGFVSRSSSSEPPGPHGG